MRMIVAYISDAKTVPARFRTPSLQWNILKIEGGLCADVTQASYGWFGQRGETAQARRRGEVRIGSGGPGFAGGGPCP
jgi:hypothetical protein